MFLKQLYHYNKYWLAAFIIFIGAFIYINFKWGYTASPLYQYGMFSGKYHVSDTQRVYQLYLDEKYVLPSTFNFVERDQLFTSLDKYKQQPAANKNIYETNLRFYNILGVGRFMHARTFQNKLSREQFTSRIRWDVAYRIPSSYDYYTRVAINYQMFQWQQGKMVAVSESKPDTSFAFNP